MNGIEVRASDSLAERASTTPDRIALIRTTDGKQWRYRDLDREVDRTAGCLARLGLGASDRIGLLLGNRVAFLRIVYAAFRLGATAVPYNSALDQATLAAQIERSDPDLLVCGADTAGVAAEIGGSRHRISVDGTAEESKVRSLDDIDPESVDPSNAATDEDRLLLYTSGTTGDPKGVRLTAGNLRASAVASAFRLGVDPDDRWLAPLPAYHMGGLAPHLRSTLYGTTAVLQPEFDADRTLQALREFDVTCLSLVPTAVRRLLDAAETVPPLRFLLCGGAPTPQSLIERCEQRGVPLCPTYGMTETASQIATALPETAREYEGTVGQPLHGTEVTIVDRDGAPVDPGAVGELVVDGPTVTPGYDDPATTDAAVGEYGLHTGDRGYRDETGRLWVTGRIDDLLVSGGENVAPSKVQKVIASAPGIDDAAVVGLDDPEWGDRVSVLVVPAADGIVESTAAAAEAFDDGHVAEHLDGRLARYEQPKTVAVGDAIPRTASGTVDREAVRGWIREHGIDLDEDT